MSQISRVPVTVAVTLAAFLMTSQRSEAVTSCKVRIDKKDGTVQVSAMGVVGQLTWGPNGNSIIFPLFDNLRGTCVMPGNPTNCQLGELDSDARGVSSGILLRILEGLIGDLCG